MGACCSKQFADGGALEDGGDGACAGEGGVRIRLQGSCTVASMYTQQGRKGINQDAMTLWEDFGGEEDRIFCGVFDGHGPYGHRVARHVRDNLPLKISAHYDALQEGGYECDEESNGTCGGDQDGWPKDLSSWKSVFVSSFKEMDKELSMHPSVDCFCSGSTAVALVKQGEHLLVANLGDSRAVLCTKGDNNQPIPVQLTVDLKPNLPKEAERIEQCRGRVFALEEEPDVHRLWLPDENCPGLAMARAFGDFCLKDFGLISVPEIFYRRLTHKDEFVVLATDGVWDVLSNAEVVKIVSSARNRSMAARSLVERAVRSWKSKFPTSRVDDCAVVCLFLKVPSPDPKSIRAGDLDSSKENSVACESVNGKADGEAVTAEQVQHPCLKEDEWEGLDGVSRANSVVKLPRFSGGVKSAEEEKQEN
ncbi:unnamed protein product [Victoria cruziana]